jgi:hypothetical protein
LRSGIQEARFHRIRADEYLFLDDIDLLSTEQLPGHLNRQAGAEGSEWA